MYLLHLRPLFVELPIFVLDGLVLLEPRDLVREQTRRNLRRAAADLRGGEERSYERVEAGCKELQIGRASCRERV